MSKGETAGAKVWGKVGHTGRRRERGQPRERTGLQELSDISFRRQSGARLLKSLKGKKGVFIFDTAENRVPQKVFEQESDTKYSQIFTINGFCIRKFTLMVKFICNLQNQYSWAFKDQKKKNPNMLKIEMCKMCYKRILSIYF